MEIKMARLGGWIADQSEAAKRVIEDAQKPAGGGAGDGGSSTDGAEQATRWRVFPVALAGVGVVALGIGLIRVLRRM